MMQKSSSLLNRLRACHMQYVWTAYIDLYESATSPRRIAV